jgi:hypothetical protein
MLEDPADDDDAGLLALAFEPALLVAAAPVPAALLADAGGVAAALEPAAAAVGGACIPGIAGVSSLAQPVRSSTSGPSAIPAPSALL